jgi:asparagine synthase (glutamine-hydrolysing)
MYGICGVVSSQPNVPLDQSIVLRMNASLRHRGPDDEGCYEDDQVSLAMRRLSIIDLHTGQQPISNESGDIWVVSNGEIYNFQKVRAALEERGHIFKTQTDTEIIVHAYEEYGDECVIHFNGMFAIALWDTRQRRLLLARDRLGIKPLYYWLGANKLVFGSELKASTLHPDVPYQPISQSEAECGEILSDLIKESVRLRLISDVPLGTFLSGGIDSSTIVGYMSQSANEPGWLPPQPSKKGLINKVKRMVEGGALDPSLQHARWMMFLNSSEKHSLYRSDLRPHSTMISLLIFSMVISKKLTASTAWHNNNMWTSRPTLRMIF